MPSNTGFTPATSGLSRTWLLEGRARPDHAVQYKYDLVLGSPSQSFGDVTRIEVPDPNRRGNFIEIGIVRGAIDRATVDVMGRYALDLRDDLLRLARARKAVDIQVHFGDCKRPNVYDGSWSKILVFSNAFLTDWGTDGALGVMDSGDNSPVNATTTISAKDLYEILPLKLSSLAGDVITNQIVDVVIADPDGPDCDEFDGCQQIFGVSLSAGGSPSTAADVVFSLDGGATWDTSEIDSLSSSEDPTGIAIVGNYVVVVSDDSNSLHYLLKSDIETAGDDTWLEVTTGFVASKQPRDIAAVGSIAFIVGNGGYIYKVSDPTAGVSVLDAGVAVVDDLLAVHAYTEKLAVAVGNNGAVVKTTDGATWSEVTPRFVGVGTHFNAVWMLDENTWLVGTSAGTLYYTTNAGVTWTQKTFPGSGSGAVRDIAFANETVGYMAHSTTAPAGRILRTTNGGNSWYVLPESVGSIPANDYIGALAACTYDTNFVAGGGLADNGSDGIMILGEV